MRLRVTTTSPKPGITSVMPSFQASTNLLGFTNLTGATLGSTRTTQTTSPLLSLSNTTDSSLSQRLQLYTRPEFNLWARVPKLTNLHTHQTISQIPFYSLDKIFTAFKLEDTRPIPFKIIEATRNKGPDIRNTAFYTKSRYLDWIWAGGLQSGNKFFVDLWDPEAIEAIDNADLDKHPRVRLIKEWRKLKEQEKEPTPKKSRKRSRAVGNWLG